MKHQTRSQLQTIAEVEPLSTYPIMTRQQRSERWAEMLEENPKRRLRALAGTEHLKGEARDAARAEGSPIQPPPRQSSTARLRAQRSRRQ